MSDKIKTPQERYRDRNREKWNAYEKERAKQKYQTDEEYRKKKRQDSLNYDHKLKDEGKTENLQKYKDTFKENHPGYYTEYNKQYNKPYYENNKERVLKMVGEKYYVNIQWSGPQGIAVLISYVRFFCVAIELWGASSLRC